MRRMVKTGSFSRVLKIELKKGVAQNIWFWIALSVGLALALVSAARSIALFNNTLAFAQEQWNSSDALYSAASCFALWMLVVPYESAPGVFMMLWPLLAMLPYSWGWCRERACGVVEQQLVRVDRKTNYVAKTIAGSVAGALAVVVPVLVNFVVCACFIPVSPVWVSDILYVGVGPESPLSSLFYTCPAAFVAVWSLIVALMAGLVSAAVEALSLIVTNFVEALTVSYLALHVLAFVGSQASLLFGDVVGQELANSEVFSLDVFSTIAVGSSQGASWALLLALLVLVALSVLVPLLLRRRDIL